MMSDTVEWNNVFGQSNGVMYKRTIKSQRDDVLSSRWSVNKYNTIE